MLSILFPFVNNYEKGDNKKFQIVQKAFDCELTNLHFQISAKKQEIENSSN